MITIQNNTKRQLEINEIYKKAQEKNIYNIEQADKKPSNIKRDVWQGIATYCVRFINTIDVYITYANCQRFGMICKYTGNNGETRLRYWTSYNIYDCKMI